MKPATVAIFGGGPAGLMAAEWLSARKISVTVYDAMPTFARKFLLAGKSGLNITHGEPFDLFHRRFGPATAALHPALADFPPVEVRRWADALGGETFEGSSGRVFPKAMKASPLLRAWLARLRDQGVELKPRHRWLGFEAGQHHLQTPDGIITISPDAALFAFGGGSWPRLGSDGGWIAPFRAAGIVVNALEPANCGFNRDWPPYFTERHAGAPVKAVVATSPAGTSQGEFVISRHGVEGSLIYAHAAALRDMINQSGHAVLTLDLAPGRKLDRLTADLARQQGKLSLSNRLRKGAGLDPVKSALLRECVPDLAARDPAGIAAAIKAMPLRLESPRPLAEAISSAGGVDWAEIDHHFMLRRHPGLFVAGEMIDWEAPTGGYLLTACFATGQAAAMGLAQYLAQRDHTV